MTKFLNPINILKFQLVWMVLSLFIFKLCPCLIYYHNDLMVYIQDLGYKLALIFSNSEGSDFSGSFMTLEEDFSTSLSFGSSEIPTTFLSTNHVNGDNFPSGNLPEDQSNPTDNPGEGSDSGSSDSSAQERAEHIAHKVSEVYQAETYMINNPEGAQEICNRHGVDYNDTKTQAAEAKDLMLSEYKDCLVNSGLSSPEDAQEAAEALDRECQNSPDLGEAAGQHSLNEFIKNSKD